MTRLCLNLFALAVLSLSCGTSGADPVFSGSSDPDEALRFIGAEKGTSVRGTVIVDGEYYTFAEKLFTFWFDRDSLQLQNLLSQSTIDFFSSEGEKQTISRWGAAMSEYLLACGRDDPRMFVTLIENVTNDEMHIAQGQYYTFPETPQDAIILYSYDSEKNQLMGRILYPVKRNGTFQLLLERPKM